MPNQLTNAVITNNIKTGKVTIAFPANGFVQPVKWEFKNEEDLIAYVAQILKLTPKNNVIGGTLKRTGKYQRIDAAGKPMFTFGDFILDLITNHKGWTKVGNNIIDFYQYVLTNGGFKGGVLTRDYSKTIDAAVDLAAQQAMLKDSLYEVISMGPDSVALGSKNPSSFRFKNSKHNVLFKAWRHDYWIYFSEGTEIDKEKGPNWKSARIDSSYFKSVGATDPDFPCRFLKDDSDSDTNDDYLEESEWIIWFKTKPVKPSGHHSFCSVHWDDIDVLGAVNKGGCGTFGFGDGGLIS